MYGWRVREKFCNGAVADVKTSGWEGGWDGTGGEGRDDGDARLRGGGGMSFSLIPPIDSTRNFFRSRSERSSTRVSLLSPGFITKTPVSGDFVLSTNSKSICLIVSSSGSSSSGLG